MNCKTTFQVRKLKKLVAKMWVCLLSQENETAYRISADGKVLGKYIHTKVYEPNGRLVTEFGEFNEEKFK